MWFSLYPRGQISKKKKKKTEKRQIFLEKFGGGKRRPCREYFYN